MTHISSPRAKASSGTGHDSPEREPCRSESDCASAAQRPRHGGAPGASPAPEDRASEPLGACEPLETASRLETSTAAPQLDPNALALIAATGC